MLRHLRWILLFVLLAVPCLAGETVWIEGEQPVSTDFVKHNWYDAVDKSVFSGREWLSHYDKARPGVARYTFKIQGGGEYAFWLRCNYFRVKIEYKLDAGAWTNIDVSNPRDTLMISPKPDHRFIGWVKVGPVALAKGDHAVEFRNSSEIANHGGIDCFCFTNEPFTPSGAAKPGPAAPAGPSDWFPVVVDDDAFSDKSVTDMSRLLDKPAGKFGFLKRDGERLRFENADHPVKFWGVGANVEDRIPPAQDATRARYLAKLGVNMVRQHPLFGFLGPLKKGELDKAKLDRYDAWFAELKKQGIYTTWSIFYPLTIAVEDGYDPALFAELEKERDGRARTYGVVNFMRPLQDLQLAYAKALLAHKNPYTGLAYKDDPALAVVEVHNEDCLFFHFPLNLLAGDKLPKHGAVLRRMFCEWAKKQYQDDTALQKSWGTKDSLAAGELSIYGAWQMKGDKADRRLGDFIRFCAELQRGFYERRERELREIGYKGVTVTTAWRAGGPGADAANLFCDTAADMIDRHNYFGGGDGQHRIVTGKIHDDTHLARAGSGILSSGLYQVENRPFCMTEWTQMPPNPWKAECAPLVAFYGMGLQGWDASYHFLNSRTRLGDGWPDLSYYVTDTPHYAGQFPALAFAVHKGHVKEAPVAAARRLKRDDLFTGLDALGQDFTEGEWDSKWVQGTPATPTEVLAIGRVTASFDGGKSEKSDWTRCWDREKQIVTSMTGELAWDMKRRVATVNTPKTQAVLGFAGGTTQKLKDATVEVKTPFVSLILTPLDDQPLNASKQILVTAMARDKQTGTRTSADGKTLEAIGGPPLLLEPVEAAITLSGPPPLAVNVLDFHGAPTGRQVQCEGGRFAIDGTYRTYYYEVQR